MEFRIPVINENQRFLDINEQPLVNGKVEVLEPVSNNFADIWQYDDDQFVIAANPIILDVEGRSEQTYFADRLVYCRVYEYQGLDENRHPIYSFVRDFYAGQDKDSESRDYVTGMEALRDLDPSINSSVNIIGYFNAWDCPLRTYVWDPNCSQDPDNGYIVGSDVSQTGRWVLVFDGEYIPSSYYGVYPGSEGNIQALMGYPDKVGSNQKPTAPGIWFVPGNYVTAISTLKNLQVDAKCQFEGTVACNRLEVVGKPSHWVADFYVDGGTVHSSWFKSARVFLTCGANEMVIDPDSYFTNKNVTNTINLMGKTIRGNNRLDVVFTQGSCYDVYDSTTLEGEIFSPTYDKVIFHTSKYGDENYSNGTYDIGSISAGHRLQYFTSNLPDITKFNNISTWCDIMTELRVRFNASMWSNYTLDFQGRSFNGTLNTGKFTDIRDVSCYSMVCDPGAVDIKLRNVKVFKTGSLSDGLQVNSGNILEVFDSNVTLRMIPNVLNFYVHNSTVNAVPNVAIDSNYMLMNIACDDSHWNVNITRGQRDDVTLDGIVRFKNCHLDNGCYIQTKHLQAYDSYFNNNVVRIYPYKDNNQVYHLDATLIGNTLELNSSPITFCKTGAADYDCYDCIVNWTITDNNFVGSNTAGLSAWHWYDPNDVRNKVLIQTHNTNTAYYSKVVYKNNIGNCPYDSMKPMWPLTGHPNASWDEAGITGSAWFPYAGNYPYYQSGGMRYCFQNFTNSTSAHPSFLLLPTKEDKDVFKHNDGYFCSARGVSSMFLGHRAYYTLDGPGDWFSVCVENHQGEDLNGNAFMYI